MRNPKNSANQDRSLSTQGRRTTHRANSACPLSSRECSASVAADVRVACRSRFRRRLEAAAWTAIALTSTLLSAGASRCWGAETDRHANRAVLRVCRIGDQPAMVFAGRELERYLRLISGATVVHMPRHSHAPEPDTLWIGCFADFPQLDHPNSRNPELDDAIVVRVKQRQGIISGANPRAVLIAAYR